MEKINKGDKVTISYIGTLDNGEVFKTIEEENPLIIQIGEQQAPPTLEIALKKMSVGEVKKIKVPPEESYGPRDKNLLQTLERDSFGKDITPKPGMILSLKVNKDGEEHTVPATVIEVNDDSVTVDYNHPLAGHNLNYEIKVLAINK